MRFGGIKMIGFRSKQLLFNLILRQTLLCISVVMALPAHILAADLNSNDLKSPTCLCRPDLYSKKYQQLESHWWGSSRSWTCEYICTVEFPVESSDHKKEERVLGSYSSRFYGEDNGDEGICEGAVMAEEYNPQMGKFVFLLQGTREFSPAKSSSQALRNWSLNNCQNR